VACEIKTDICNHKLFKGDSTILKEKEGFDTAEVSPDAKLMIFYVTNLILLGKKQDALKTITDFGKYFFDKDLSEANLRKLKGLALMPETTKQLNDSMSAIKEFLKANIIF